MMKKKQFSDNHHSWLDQQMAYKVDNDLLFIEFAVLKLLKLLKAKCSKQKKIR